MKTKNFILFLMVVSIVVFLSSCGKTGQDKEWEKKLVGTWIPVDSDGKEYTQLPRYIFEENTNGCSYVGGNSNGCDKFKWEIKKKELDIYYDDAPTSYVSIAYDKYGMRSRMKIESFNDDTKINVVMYTYQGIQREFILKKSLPDEDDDDDEEDLDPDKI